MQRQQCADKAAENVYENRKVKAFINIAVAIKNYLNSHLYIVLTHKFQFTTSYKNT